MQVKKISDKFFHENLLHCNFIGKTITPSSTFCTFYFFSFYFSRECVYNVYVLQVRYISLITLKRNQTALSMKKPISHNKSGTPVRIASKCGHKDCVHILYIITLQVKENMRFFILCRQSF